MTRDDNGTFQWSAFDPNLCNYFYHNGQQIRFYRVRPWGTTYERFRPTWLDRAVEWFLRVMR